MTKAELIADIAARTGLSKAQAKDALDAFVASVTDSLRRGEEVRMVGFGVFTPVARPAAVGRNPKTGEQVMVAASKSARFRIAEALRDALN
jgi:DNA-binding protein HU-beta